MVGRGRSRTLGSIGLNREGLPCRERPADSELDVVHLDLADAADDLAGIRTGDGIFYGVFPAFEDDGLRHYLVPPDPDGQVRPQPRRDPAATCPVRRDGVGDQRRFLS